MPLCSVPSVGELWMSLEIKACWEFIEELLTVSVYLYLHRGSRGWAQVDGERDGDDGSIQSMLGKKLDKEIKQKSNWSLPPEKKQPFSCCKLGRVGRTHRTGPEKHDVRSDQSLQGCDHTFLPLPLWCRGPRLALRFSSPGVRKKTKLPQARRGGNKIKKTQIPQTFSHLLFSESESWEVKGKREMPNGGGWRREGGRETWSTRPILTSKTSQRFSLEKDLDWFSKTFRKKERERKKERTLLGVRSFTAAWLWLVRGVSRACDPAPVDKLIYCILLRAPWGGREEQNRRFAASCSTSESFYLSSWAFFLNESEMLDCLLLRDLFWMGEGIFKDYDDIWLRCLFEAPCQASCLQVHIGTELGLTPERKHM